MSPATAAGRSRQARLFEGLRREAPDRAPAPGARRERGGCADGGRTTLEQRLGDLLAEARVTGTTDCPVCRAPMAPHGDAEAACTGCGSVIG